MSAPASAPSIVVVGAGAANLKSAVAANLVAALTVLDVAVALRDHDGASTRALAGDTAAVAVVALPWAGRPIAVVPGDARLDDPRLASARLVVVDPPPRLGEATRRAIDEAALVLVPVDASSLARRVLREVAALVAASAEPGRLRVALSRVVPRDADRWALVESIDGDAPGALLHATLPMARARRAGTPQAAGTLAPAPLYAPGTAAARAYARLARELVDALQLGDATAARVSTTA